jgi:hypothetical protein
MNAPLFPLIPWHDIGGQGGQFIATVETEAEAVAFAKAENEKGRMV